MDAWTTFLGWLLVVYALLTITIGGFFDVKEMLTTMGQQKKRMTNGEQRILCTNP